MKRNRAEERETSDLAAVMKTDSSCSRLRRPAAETCFRSPIQKPKRIRRKAAPPIAPTMLQGAVSLMQKRLSTMHLGL